MKRKLWALLLSLALVVTLLTPVAGTLASETTPAPTEESSSDSQTPEPAAALTEAPEQVENSNGEPTNKPTEIPTEQPTEIPTEQPTENPTEQPTENPTEQPTENPIEQPTENPTEQPTENPTEQPTEVPTEEPTETPVADPTEEPQALSIRVTTNQRCAFEGDGVSATASIAGGVAPYTVRGVVSVDGTVLSDETVTLEAAGTVDFSAKAAYGTVRFAVQAIDALGNAVDSAATTPVAVNVREDESDWAASVRDVELTGDWREDILAVAKSQLGYEESKRNFIVRPDGSVQGYTRYGDWYGLEYEEWCAMFVSFCLNYAQIPAADFPRESGCQPWIEDLAWIGLYEDDEDSYEPQPGDLIFFQWENDDRASHVGIVEYVADGWVHTIEGNSAASVRRQEYALTDRVIIGYGNMTKAMERAGLFENEPEIPAEPEELPVEEGLVPVEEPDASATEAMWQVGEAEVSLSYAVDGASGYVWQRRACGSDAEWENVAEGSDLLISATIDNMKYEYRCTATLADGSAMTSDAITLIDGELIDWILTSEIPVDMDMLARAMSAKSLESMVFEGNELVYVRTGESVATYDPSTNELVDNRFNITVAIVDRENGVIYPIATESADAE